MSADVPYLPTCIPLPLKEQELKELVSKSKDWTIMHGAAMRSKTNFNPDTIEFAPFVLLPSTFIRKDFEKILETQITFNELVHKIAYDKEFLTSCLKETIEVDEFTRRLFEIYETVEKEGVSQPVALGLLRSDYMMHSRANNSLKQVELNCIASSLAGIATTISECNRYVLQELDYHEKLKCIPQNKALSGLCQGMLDAWKIYGNSKAVILFIVEDVTINICDQRFHEFEIRRLNPNVKVIRRTLTEMGNRASLSTDKELVVDDLVCGVVYYRAAYEPEQYPSKLEWDARLLIERSKAIKCPTIQYHLAGTKKVQQELAKPGAIERFFSDAGKVRSVRDVFVGLYGLGFDDLGDKAVQMALDDPDRFVLKPQREGGGNNVYGADVKDAILKMKDSKERTAWILMERIRPPIVKGYIVRAGGENPPTLSNLVSELGVYGVIIGDSHNIVVNRQTGHMLRTKLSTADEGGVAAGIGALDSPYLID